MNKWYTKRVSNSKVILCTCDYSLQWWGLPIHV